MPDRFKHGFRAKAAQYLSQAKNTDTDAVEPTDNVENMVFTIMGRESARAQKIIPE